MDPIMAASLYVFAVLCGDAIVKTDNGFLMAFWLFITIAFAVLLGYTANLWPFYVLAAMQFAIFIIMIIIYSFRAYYDARR
jgi:hypothetical protein